MRDYEKFFTYPETADFMVKLLDPKSFELILEPSAGNGALVKALRKVSKKSYIHAIELNKKWEPYLKKISDSYEIADFLTAKTLNIFDKCIANPPFGNGVNLEDHFSCILSIVKKGGKIVMIVPEDFNPGVDHISHSLENWSKNSDGTTTPIKIIEFSNPF